MNLLNNTRHVYLRFGTRFLGIRTKEDIDKVVKNNKIIVFMKGVPEQPQCGFSNAVAQILKMHGVNYEAYNVLEDDDLRQGKFQIIFGPFTFRSSRV